ncbi:amidase [Siminovitchia sediminis]|uniref:Amidase n=1 Tax=Siminovitchia sediminis TaxID=1274353 RepID=A0ABW4KFN0_9BACI
MENIIGLSLSQVAALIRKKELSPVEVTRNIIKEIEEKNMENNAFITISNALESARDAEKEILNGNYKGPLHGIPLAIKDNISVKGLPCTNGSVIDQKTIMHSDALLVRQLRYEGAIIIGKTNLDEYANHVVGKNKNYGTIVNPLNSEHSAGGSSGGSAVAVASNLCYGAIGTDTSGSVRIPAACCGIVGLKPTFNLIPTDGVTPLSWSLDHVGILSKDCTDLSLIFQSIVPGSRQKLIYQDPSADTIKELTIGIPDNYFFELLSDEVEKKIEEVIDLFISHGSNVKQIHIPYVEKAMMVQEDIIGAEGSYLHKFQLEDYKEDYDKDNYEYFTHGLSITKDKYKEALTIRQRMNKEIQQLFDSVDILLTPTLPITAPKQTDETITWEGAKEDILSSLSRFTGPFNVSGLPALSIPVGYNTDGLSISLQIVGNLYSENQIISTGNWIMDKML